MIVGVPREGKILGCAILEERIEEPDKGEEREGGSRRWGRNKTNTSH